MLFPPNCHFKCAGTPLTFFIIPSVMCWCYFHHITFISCVLVFSTHCCSSFHPSGDAVSTILFTFSVQVFLTHCSSFPLSCGDALSTSFFSFYVYWFSSHIFSYFHSTMQWCIFFYVLYPSYLHHSVSVMSHNLSRYFLSIYIVFVAYPNIPFMHYLYSSYKYFYYLDCVIYPLLLYKSICMIVIISPFSIFCLVCHPQFCLFVYVLEFLYITFFILIC